MAKKGWTVLLAAVMLLSPCAMIGCTAAKAGAGSASDQSNIGVYLAGDSTVASYSPDRAPLAGWGQKLQSFFTSGVQVHNYAASGRSSKSFIDEGRLQPILDQLKAGDFFFIQFGHNDEKTKDPNVGTDPYTTYISYLSQYIDGARLKGAIPVLVTPMQRGSFDAKGRLKQTHGDYPAAMIQLGAEKNVPVIRLHEKSKGLFERLGEKATQKLFMMLEPGEYPNYPDGSVDLTHFNEYGASEMARLVVQGVLGSGLSLSSLIRDVTPAAGQME
ncbi:rhamnogalacturonan acetylesterase [Paenibacillus allorhizosphaerae]|uniref:Rhamnogalacturonan acetylesterase RhgT n=1 Tax=Paenibacillus allorhizosphaerae TaxID=2849866 RepID=A0ABN7TLW2_9BACL|nr:rhamnogalacturonan acetylesterase [Paenibacillus allorhizosphaerae]CAG7637920.1 Rhamnogalacturonan acetylesterase RhgT [Paenibacillus allorhizosphaerae]